MSDCRELRSSERIDDIFTTTLRSHGANMSVISSTRVFLDDVSADIICQVWPALRGRRLRQDYYSSLLTHLKREFAKQIRSPHPIKDSDIQHIFSSLDLLKKNADKPLSQVSDIIRTDLEESCGLKVLHIIGYLTRAWLTIGFDTSDFLSQSKAAASGRTEIIAPLEEIVKGRFHNLVSSESARSDDTLGRFTMRYLIDKHGWTVSWTSDLTEHLSVNPRTKFVKVYEHKICLLHHFKFEGLHPCPIPREAIREALDTLNLLFPSEDVLTQRYLQDEGKSFHRLGSCNRDNYRDLSHYHYWHTGLAQLLRATEEEPLGFKQFILDREHRNFREVTTFWLAVVVIVFLTLGFGVISTVFAAKSYQVAMMQYNLDLAQACSMPGARVSLSRYCA
ncbi:hypothetical protein F4680DRAFT_206549 [Xylaria scruposa]|nr:hypothetical protein F4680DRAFT_206549 [Xylaria scruposa]